MKTAILFFLLFSQYIFAQSIIPDNAVGTHNSYDNQGRMITTTNPVVHNSNYKPVPSVIIRDNADSNISFIRYTYTEPAAIGTYCVEAGNGNSSIVGWYLNNQRTSCYGNSNSTPIWEHAFANILPYDYVAVSNNGGAVTSGFGLNIFLFNGTNGSTTLNFDLTTLPDTGVAGPVAVTSGGNFLVGSTSRNDSSTVFGFNSSSNVPVWRYRIPTGIQGIKISGNDSLIIVNTYSTFWVMRTYTGAVLYSGAIGGTQTNMAISGNGNIIAIINYTGYVKAYQWNGATYNMLWQHQEPPGTYYNWMTAVDVSYDGNYIACGTLNFITSSTYDGKVKLFHSTSSTPIWTYTGMGDEVNAVSFSKNGRFLCAGSWGDYYTHTAKNLLVFKTSDMVNLPLFSTVSPGSFMWCSISDDGQTVIGSGKAVHARAFGNGGIYYNVFIDSSASALVTGIHNIQSGAPSKFELSQNYPNPFNPTTLVNYTVAKDGLVNITVYDVLGREVATLVNKFERVGNYSISFDASNLNSGIYLYRIRTDNFTDSKKMVLVK